jgi:hypothetical protein
LGNDTNRVSGFFKDPSDDSSPVGWMIHIGITRDENDIEVIPSPLHHFFVCHWEKISHNAFIVTEESGKGETSEKRSYA